MRTKLGQGRIREPLVQRSRKHRINAVQGMIRTRALIQSEGKFVDIPLEMFLGDLMIDTIDTPRFMTAHTDSMPLVCTLPSTNSFALCLTV